MHRPPIDLHSRQPLCLMVAAQGGRWGGHLWNLFALPASSMLLRARVTFIFLSITFFLVGRLGFHLLPCLLAFTHSLAMRQKMFKYF